MSDEAIDTIDRQREEEVSPNDYLTGRGGHVSRHEGNGRVRRLMRELDQYTDKNASRATKKALVNLVIDDVHARGGKILKKAGGTMNQSWVECGESESRQKISQRFREESRHFRREETTFATARLEVSRRRA